MSWHGCKLGEVPLAGAGILFSKHDRSAIPCHAIYVCLRAYIFMALHGSSWLYMDLSKAE